MLIVSVYFVHFYNVEIVNDFFNNKDVQYENELTDFIGIKIV